MSWPPSPLQHSPEGKIQVKPNPANELDVAAPASCMQYLDNYSDGEDASHFLPPPPVHKVIFFLRGLAFFANVTIPDDESLTKARHM